MDFSALWVRRRDEGTFVIMSGPEAAPVELFELSCLNEDAWMWKASNVEEPGGLETVLNEAIESSSAGLGQGLATIIRTNMSEETPGFVRAGDSPFEVQVPRDGVYRILSMPGLEILGEVKRGNSEERWFSHGFTGQKRVSCRDLERAVGRLLTGQTKEQSDIDDVVSEIKRLEKVR